jgi:hypothetical protein
MRRHPKARSTPCNDHAGHRRADHFKRFGAVAGPVNFAAAQFNQNRSDDTAAERLIVDEKKTQRRKIQ